MPVGPFPVICQRIFLLYIGNHRNPALYFWGGKYNYGDDMNNDLLVVPRGMRKNFLVGNFTKLHKNFEFAVRDFAKQVVFGYAGAYWEYVYTSSGAPFLYPAIEGSVLSISHPDPDSVIVERVPVPLGGLILTIYAIDMLIDTRSSSLSRDEISALVATRSCLSIEGRVIAGKEGCTVAFELLVAS